MYTIGMRHPSPNQTLKQQLTDYVNRFGMYDSYNDIQMGKLYGDFPEGVRYYGQGDRKRADTQSPR